MKQCPYCAEEIQDQAVKCRFCNERLETAAADKSRGPRYDLFLLTSGPNPAQVAETLKALTDWDVAKIHTVVNDSRTLFIQKIRQAMSENEAREASKSLHAAGAELELRPTSAFNSALEVDLEAICPSCGDRGGMMLPKKRGTKRRAPQTPMCLKCGNSSPAPEAEDVITEAPGNRRIPRWVFATMAILFLIGLALPNSDKDEPEVSTASVSSNVDGAATLSMLRAFASYYNADDFVHASRFISSTAESECGGPLAVAFALSQVKRMEQIDYTFTNVVPAGGESMADVSYFETWDGTRTDYELGLAFVYEGEWKFDDLFPFGAAAFCN